MGRLEKKRKREERKSKYFDRKKAAKQKQRAQKEEDEFHKALNDKFENQTSQSNDFEDFIGGDFIEKTHLVKGLDFNLLRQTKAKIAKKQMAEIEDAYNETMNDSNLQKNERLHAAKTINTKFCNGMIYKFNVNEFKSSIPSELIRSQIDNMQIDEFEHDNMQKIKMCNGYTPKTLQNEIKKSLKKNKNKKRSLQKMKKNDDNVDDFDIFADVGKNIKIIDNAKRRRI